MTLVPVCVSVKRSVVERLCPHFVTNFHRILHAAQKCGRVDAYCVRDKPEVKLTVDHLCEYTVRYRSTSQANSAFHPIWVDK